MPTPGSKLTPRQRTGRSALKRFLYSQLALMDVFKIGFGEGKPLVQFKVEADPPSVYYNFEIPEEKIEELQKTLNPPFPLAKLQCIEGEEPFYCLTANMYRVSGLATGIRCEWSLYCEDPEGTTRYLVVEAQADSGAVDPVNLITRGIEDCTHTHTPELLESRVKDETGGVLHVKLTNPDEGEPCRAMPEWVEANDYIYWMNGLCDRTFYDSGLANARTHLIDPGRVEISDTTGYAKWVLPQPRHVVVFEHSIEFAMSPWWNMQDRELLVG